MQSGRATRLLTAPVKTVGFGRNGGDLAIEVAAFAYLTYQIVFTALEHSSLILREQQRR